MLEAFMSGGHRLGVAQLLVALSVSVPGGFCFRGAPEACLGLASRGERLSPFADPVAREEKQRALDETEHLLPRSHRKSVLGGLRQEARGAHGVCGGARLVEVVSDLAGALAGAPSVDTLQRVRDREVIRLESR